MTFYVIIHNFFPLSLQARQQSDCESQTILQRTGCRQQQFVACKRRSESIDRPDSAATIQPVQRRQQRVEQRK